MEEAREFAAVSEDAENNELLETISRGLQSQKVDIEIFEKFFKRLLTETKYLILAHSAAMFFCIEKLGIDIKASNFSYDRLYLLPFLFGFIFAAYCYWECFKSDRFFTVLEGDYQKLSKNNIESEIKKDPNSKDILSIMKRANSCVKTLSSITVRVRSLFDFSGLMFVAGIVLIVFSIIGVDSALISLLKK